MREEPPFAWVDRAASRRAQTLTRQPETADKAPEPAGPVCGAETVLWPGDEHLEVVCQLPAGHGDNADDDHIEHEDGSLSWLTTVDVPAKETSVTPDDVRAIVREEIREAFRVLAAQASDFPGYETDTIEDTAARMLERVSEGVADVLRHASTCKLRNGGRYYSSCDCGAKD
jgi:hypothetical protein